MTFDGSAGATMLPTGVGDLLGEPAPHVFGASLDTTVTFDTVEDSVREWSGRALPAATTP